jgi:hypothetical protein
MIPVFDNLLEILLNLFFCLLDFLRQFPLKDAIRIGQALHFFFNHPNDPLDARIGFFGACNGRFQQTHIGGKTNGDGMGGLDGGAQLG